MSSAHAPLVELDASGKASVLSYNVPDPTSYTGRFYIEIDLPFDWTSVRASHAVYFEFPPIPEPNQGELYALQTTSRENAPAMEASLSAATRGYLSILKGVYRAMRSGFQSDGPPFTVDVSPVKRDALFPDVGEEAQYLRYALSYTHWMAKLQGVEVTAPTHLPNPDASTGGPSAPAYIDYVGVYSVKETPEGSFNGLAPALRNLSPELIVEQMRKGNRLVVFRDDSEVVSFEFEKVATGVSPRFFIVEEYRLSSYLGDYGAGRTIKTISLLPGEKSRLSLKSYKRSATTAKGTSNILDSFSSESATDFQDALESEQTDKEASARHDEGYVEAEVSGNWGTGSAKVSGGYKGASSNAREQFARGVSKALQKHAARASSKRDVKVEQSTESHTESGEETDTEREIQNVNVGRTLNFVFRQMNQEFISVLHLVDVKVGFTNDTLGSRKIVPLSQLDELVRPYVNPISREDPSKSPYGDDHWVRDEALTEARVTAIKDRILSQIQYVRDYRGVMHDMVDVVETRRPLTPYADPAKPSDWWVSHFARFKPQTTDYMEGTRTRVQAVPGVILAVMKNVLRTDGVVVEALLGLGDGLDVYSHGLQDETTRAKALASRALQAELRLERLKHQLIQGKDSAAAELFAQMFPPPPTTP